MADRVETLRLKIDGKEVVNSQKDLQVALRTSKKELTALEEGSDKWIKKSQDINTITERLDDVKTKNKEVANDWKKQTVDFKKGITEKIDGMTLFGLKVGDVRKGFKQLRGSLTSMSKATKLFNAALWASPIFIIAGILAAVIGYFTKTQEGMDKITMVTRVFSDILGLLLNKAIAFGKAAFKIFNGLVKILTNPMNPAEGIRILKEGIEDTTEVVDGLGDSFTQTFKNAVELVKLEKEFKKLNRESELAIAQMNAVAERLAAIADDATRSFREREQAAKLARQQSELAAKEQTKIAERQATLVAKEIAQAKLAGSVTTELKDKQKEATIALIEAQMEEQSIFLENEQRKRELIQDRLEKNLDIEIDGFDVVKSLNEKKLENEKLTAKQLQEIKDETDRLGDLSFKKQIAIIQEFTKIQINANDLINESNSTLLQQKIRELELSEIIEGRLFEVIKERRIATQDLAEAQKEITEKSQKEVLEAVDKAYQDELTLLKEQRLAEQLTEEQFNDNKEELELAHLIAIKSTREQLGLETTEIEEQILDKELEFLARRIAAEEEAAAKQAKLDKKALDAQKKAAEERAKIAKKELEAKKAKIKSLGEEAGAVLATAKTLEGAAKGLLSILRREIKGYLANAVAAAIKGAIAKSGNPLIGLALAPVAAGAVSGLFDKFVPSFNTGGETGRGDLGLGRNTGGFIRGVVEEDEFVIPKGLRNDPYVANLTGYVENRIKGISNTPPPVINNEVSSTIDINSAGDLKEAGMMMLEAATVLANTRLQSELSLDNIRNIKEVTDRDDKRKEENFKRGSLF